MKKAILTWHQCQCHLSCPTFTMKERRDLYEKPRDPPVRIHSTWGRGAKQPQPTVCYLRSRTEDTRDIPGSKQVCSKILASNAFPKAQHLISHIPSTLDSYYIVSVSSLAFSNCFFTIPFSLDDSRPLSKEGR